jgi:hypothetical protein
MAAVLRVFDEAPGARRVAGVTLRLASERIRVRDIIRQRVEDEVSAFNVGNDNVYRGLVQPTDAEQVVNGYKIKKGRQLDAQRQVDVALRAFERNGFVILFDDRQLESLDDEITLSGENAVTFLRLTPLVGG